MKGRALGAAFVAALISALTGSLAWADNPHGTPPGQANLTSASVTASASASAENQGQAKKAEESSTTSSSAGPSANASAQAQANAAEHTQASSNGSNNSNSSQSNAAASSANSPSADSQTKLTPGGSKFDNCSGTTNTTTSPGVKPSTDTKHWTCATADSNQTKEYGNGTTAGQGVIARGGSPKTKLYGPGNSQPHMVAPCPGSRHMRDWHAVKSYNPASCSSPGTSSSCSLQPGQVRVNGQCVWPCPNNQAMPASGQCGSSSNTTTVTTSTSVTNNSTTNNSVTNNSTTNNSTTNNSVTNNNSSTNNSSITRHTPSSGVQGAQHSSSPKKTAAATAPAAKTSPAASTAPASTKGVLGTSTPSSGSLPFTGLPLWLPALLALGLAVGGFTLLRLGRTRA